MVEPTSLKVSFIHLVGVILLLNQNIQKIKSRSTNDSITNRLAFEEPVQDRVSLLSFKRQETSRRNVQCGQSLNPYTQRIVGGRVATISDYPWIVSLQREKGFWFGFKGFYHFCGGSLITSSWIVTAAHCFYNRDDTIRIVAGTDNMNYLYRAQLRTIEKIISHEEFDIETYNNDIALIKVSQPFVLDSTFSKVGTICLERDLPIIPYDIAQICGFGAKEFRQKARSHLYATEIAIIDQKTCNFSFNDAITDNMICAGGMIAHKRDACSGDSGGPLMLENDDHMSLIGVVSFGNDCALQNYPGIYTRINNYIDWILQRIDEPLVNP